MQFETFKIECLTFRTDLKQNVTTAIRGVEKNSEENMHIVIKT